MTDLVSLLYRADWTRLSLAAEVTASRDLDLDRTGGGAGRVLAVPAVRAGHPGRARGGDAAGSRTRAAGRARRYHQVLHLLHDSRAGGFTATLHQWQD